MKKQDQKTEVPRLSPEIKNLNGKSGRKLRGCIDKLCETLDDVISTVKQDQNVEHKVPKHN